MTNDEGNFGRRSENRNLLERRGWPQRDLMQKSGIDEAAITNLENERKAGISRFQHPDGSGMYVHCLPN